MTYLEVQMKKEIEELEDLLLFANDRIKELETTLSSISFAM